MVTTFPIIIIISLFFIINWFASFYVLGKIYYDDNKIPVVDYGVMENITIGKKYNPITIAQHSDKFYNEFINNNNETAKDIFLNYVNWLVNNSIKVGNYSFFTFDFPFPVYDLKQPWYSAMAQAEVLPRLLNAYEITKDPIYLTTAKNALNVLFIDINHPCKCGVTYKSSDDGWWYEEYANGHGNGPRVLNGMMFTLVDIFDFYNFTKDSDALYLFNQGILSLKNNLHNYDKNDTYSSYDKIKGYAPIEYHNIHVCLLDKLYNITKDNLFKKYYDSWSKNSSAKLLNKDPLSQNCI